MANNRISAQLTSDRYSIIVGGTVATLIGMVICLVVATTATNGPYWSSAAQLVMYMVAAIVISGLLGFIFGVPRARTDAGQQTTKQYLSNSNLEQISDWLTKILVGAGLVQLAALPSGFSALGNYLGTGMDLPNSATISAAVVLYGLGVGFLFFYLWARLRLRVLLEKAEKQAEEQSRTQVEVATHLAKAVEKSDTVETTVAISRAATNATAVAAERAAQSLPSMLWVDDYPVNNDDIAAALQTLGITVDLALSTEDAMSLISTRSYGLIITDLGRTEQGTEKTMAGLELIQKVRAKGVKTPIFVYAGYRAVQLREELIKAGASLVTNRPTEVFTKAVEVLTGRPPQ